MHSPAEILRQYWGYDSFRKGQEAIVHSVLEGHDTLALLPTGGGKSICFQVPAMCMEGLCVVISPLLALMFDQVENLSKRNIPAAAVTSAMSSRELEKTLYDAIHLRIKFLYVSPERLQNPVFIERLKAMKVSLIAVDEAHCISQWGYDFRPSYLEIALIREYHPKAPVIALTATATPTVVADIQVKLRFAVTNVMSSSFRRDNLSYIVLKEEDKDGKMVELCKKIKGTGIIYCGTRLRTRDVAQWLTQQGIKADYYHAGLKPDARDKVYRSWLSGTTRVICATNAFGMGIDKPDVRFVVHADVPSHPEAYFQEAGRAGRDTLEAYAILLFHPSDTDKLLRQVDVKYPPPDFLNQVYFNLCDYYRIAIGSGKDSSHVIDAGEFAKRYEIRPAEVLYAIRILESAGYLSLNESATLPSRLHIPASKMVLYNFQVTQPSMDSFVKLLLRMYGGLFEQYVSIREEEIAKNSKLSLDEVQQKLRFLQQYEIIDYTERTDLPRLTFLLSRSASKQLNYPEAVYASRKQAELERCRAMIRYLTLDKCRSMQLLEYFGERDSGACGKCDVCRARKKQGMSAEIAEAMNAALSEIALRGDVSITDIPLHLPQFNKEELTEFLRWKIDKGELELNTRLEVVLPGMS